MIITTDFLVNNKACKQGIEFVQKFYPNGVEMIDLIKDPRISKEMLHWGRKQLTHTKEELDAYCQICNITNSSGFWYSENVRDSLYVVKSFDVSSSKHVFNSKSIERCIDVSGSEQIEDSSKVFISEWVTNSSKVYSSKNIENSQNICNTTLTIGAKNVYGSTNILNSTEIINSQNITNSICCTESQSLTNCLFCYGLKDMEYCIFNKPIDKERFNTYKKQYLKLMQDVELSFIEDWPESLVQSITPALDLNLSHYYKSAPPKFWKWVRTLPNFNEQILYQITMRSEALNLN